jgi:hypothetical protein
MTTTSTALGLTLQDQGYRFVLQDGRYDWAHPAEVGPDAIDCTDMSDDEFERVVRYLHASAEMLKVSL